LVDAALGAYASVAVLIAGSIAAGQAVLSLCGRREFTWLSGPVGLAAILVISGIAIRLPGHGTAVAIALAILFVLSLGALVLLRRGPGTDPANVRSMDARTVRCRDAERSPGAFAGPAGAAAGLTLLLASIPFIVNGRVGILGVGLVNDDMASHLLIADWLNTRVGQTPGLVEGGYPVGPHALAAGLSEGLGTGLVEAFAGITLAIPALTALLAFEALRGLRPIARLLAATLVALPYLAAAYLAQGAFKEPIEALFLLGFALLMPGATTARRGVPLAVIAAGAVYAYSFPGLFWLLGTAAIYVAVGLIRGARPLTLGSGARLAVVWGGAAAVAAVLVVLIAPDLGRIVDFTDFRAFRNSTISSGLGNLRHQLSPLEALGVWPASDFRLSASAASVPAPFFYLAAAVAAVALVVALPHWLRRHGEALPAALAAAIVIYLGALAFGTVYTSAKALAIAAPVITLITFGGLLGHERSGPSARARSQGSWRPGLALALAAGIALSSLLVLRQAPVAPDDHADQLAELRPLVQGRKLLFLGRDNFISYELRGSRPFTAVRNYYDPNYVRPNLRLEDVFRKFDFDSVNAAKLGRFPYVITTRATYASGPPSAFEPLRVTKDFVLWRRTEPVGRRRTLAEADRPGAPLDCSSPDGRRLRRSGATATVFAAPPVIGGAWSPSSTVESGSDASLTLKLSPGRWWISVQYDSTRALRIRAPGMAATVPANLDYRGSVPFYAAGELTVLRGGPVRFTASVERLPLAGRLLGAHSVAHLGTLAATPARGGHPGEPMPGLGEPTLPLRRACGRYLDWYRPQAGG
jgi:hypothetical protein